MGPPEIAQIEPFEVDDGGDGDDGDDEEVPHSDENMFLDEEEEYKEPPLLPYEYARKTKNLKIFTLIFILVATVAGVAILSKKIVVDKELSPEQEMLAFAQTISSRSSLSNTTSPRMARPR